MHMHTTSYNLRKIMFTVHKACRNAEGAKCKDSDATNQTILSLFWQKFDDVPIHAY